MSDKVAQVHSLMSERDAEAKFISLMWDSFNNQRGGIRDNWAELDSFLFATDTRTTSVGGLGWKNSTTLPKLTQIRDNLHSNYMAALFPNDKWLIWQAYTKKAASHKTASTITSYMGNKLREGNFRTTMSRLVYDYIDKGNAFGRPKFERRYNHENNERVADFVGPKAERISPHDIVFDPTASDFKYTPKIVRSVETLGSIAKLIQQDDRNEFWQRVLDRRNSISNAAGGGMTKDDWEKAQQYSIDGFGSLQEYYMGHHVEILEFYGDYYNTATGELKTNRMITVADRSVVVRDEPAKTYSGVPAIFHAGWRLRPNNLWAMGPLENLVGLQYRLDHLENLKADAMDLVVHPPLEIRGEVEAFEWGPGAEIHVDAEGSGVTEISKNLGNLIAAQTEMQTIEDRMELYAGAPREAMGIRTPGEKTAFEFDGLMTAAGRIFQEKATNIEINLEEPLINGMFEEAHRNFSGLDTIVVLDEEFKTNTFMDITKDAITAEGILRPVGARHFAQQSKDLVNLNNLFNGPVGQMLAPHTSGKELTRLVDNVLNLRGYEIFSPNVAIMEAQETQRLQQTAAEDLEVESEGQVEGDELVEEDVAEEEEAE